MTDPELVEKKLAEIETYLRELRSLAEPDRIRSDVKAGRGAGPRERTRTGRSEPVAGQPSGGAARTLMLR